MYAISNVSRVYITSFFLLCAAFFLAPSVANANEYWSVLEKRFIPQENVPNAVKEMLGHKVARPSGSTLNTVPSAPTVSKNALGGLSATTNNILKTFEQPSSFSSTLNNSAASAKTALKSCVRSPACAGRALGAGAIIYEGIKGWQSVYEFVLNDDGVISKPEGFLIVPLPDHLKDSSYTTNLARRQTFTSGNCSVESGWLLVNTESVPSIPNAVQCYSCREVYSGRQLTGYIAPETCEYQLQSHFKPNYEPVPLSELDNSIDESYTPEVSDAPIVLLSGEPETISLTIPEPANLPATTTTSTDSQGKTTTTVKNSVITYNILNNNTSSPSIESIITETSNTYDDTANLVGSSTSTTTNNSVQPDPLPPSAGASADIELPVFCTWAKPLCDWLGWTQEDLGEEEPDLSQLITEFEPDEDGYDFNIGSGSCPAPMQLNLGIINKTVEVKYDPFCDFLEMIKPFVLAAAYLFAAYLYVGVLRRG